jgi:hypothetical protein
MTSPTIQPSSAAPAQTRIESGRARHDQSRPGEIRGMLMARPITSSATLPPGSRSDGDHVVQAHDDVGNGNDPHCPQMLDRPTSSLSSPAPAADRDIEQRSRPRS